ncbi:MAG TPA: hypothetical protein VML01_13680 [Bryobacterales bacterium]|nr:hypothetical protein [Bryobacterales bacterium]
MKIIGDRKYVEIPGQGIHELPPLLLKEAVRPRDLEETVGLAEKIVSSDHLVEGAVLRGLADEALESHKFGMAINLAEQYGKFLNEWRWGESIVEWIRQCEITFDTQPNLRPLLHPDVWPHAGRSSFVNLLSDKGVAAGEVKLQNAVGFRLTFRQPPPIDFFSDQFLFLLNSTLAEKAYQTWADVSDNQNASLPPERFQFFVMSDEIHQV